MCVCECVCVCVCYIYISIRYVIYIYVRQRLHRQPLDFHCFIGILKTRNKSIDLIFLGMSFHISGTKNDNDSVTLYVLYVSLFPIS